jgi:hypothetical protein
MTILNDDARIINKRDVSLTDAPSVIIYDRHLFIVQATGASCGSRIQTFNPRMMRRVLYYCATNVDHMQ